MSSFPYRGLVEDRLPRLHVFPHEAGDSGADLVEFKALGDPGVGHTIEGLLVVDPVRGEITAHLLKCVFVEGAGLCSHSSCSGILFALWGAGCYFREVCLI